LAADQHLFQGAELLDGNPQVLNLGVKVTQLAREGV
jgi:hypothetical protein